MLRGVSPLRMNPVDEGIIDIQRYLKTPRAGGGGAFSVWGGEGERARFALPVWRSVFLLGGERGGIFHLGVGDTEPCVPFFVLDLAQDPARTTFRRPPEALCAQQDAPVVSTRGAGGVLVFLGEEAGRRWYLEVDGGEEKPMAVGRRREELLFLAGECAGLLFFREFAGGVD